MALSCTTTFSHPVCDELCKRIAKKSNGVIFAMCSLGKDSLASILYCKRFFKRIIPFCCSSYPCLKCHERWLHEEEEALGMHILRLVGEELPMSLRRGMYQYPDTLEDIFEMDDVDFDKIELLEYLRKTYNLPRAWCAVGISVGDSIDRRIYCKKIEGKNESHLTFYPLWAAERSDILSICRNSGIRLPDFYRYSCRSMAAMPGYTNLKILRENYPEDYERVLSYWPLAEAKTYRERMLDFIWRRRSDLGIVAHNDGGEDDGLDILPDVRMADMDLSGDE